MILHLECLGHSGELELTCNNTEIEALLLLTSFFFKFWTKNAVARDDSPVQTMRI